MKNILSVLRQLLILIAILNVPSAFANSESYANRVTIEVPSYLFINGDQKDLRLTFSDYKAGAESNTQDVIYTVSGNNMTQPEGAPAVSARLDDSFSDIDLKARVGSYIKESGNIELGPVSSDFVSIGNSETAIAKKSNSTGDGKLLRGQVAISYKAVATATLKAGEYSRQLTLTLTDV